MIDFSSKASILARVPSNCLKTYDEYGFSYDETGFTYDQKCKSILTEFVVSQARIKKLIITQVTIQAHLNKLQVSTLAAQSRVKQLYSTEIIGKSRIQQIQIVGFNSLALIRPAGHFQAQARLSQYRQLNLTSQSRILYYHLTTFSSQAQLVRVTFLDIQSRIRNIYKPTFQTRSRIIRQRLTQIRIRGRIWPYSRIRTRARIKDVSWKRRYINSLSKPLAQGTIPGRGAILVHTNGNIYCVYADGYFNNVCERRLYVTISTDGGLTWGTRIQLTSGSWDNSPSLLQLDESSTSSDIGIAFIRGVPRNIYRLTFTTDGVTNYGPQPIMYGQYNTNNAQCPNLVKLTNGKFRIFYINSTLSRSISYCESTTTSYTGTTQWNTIISKYPGNNNPTALYIINISVRKHKDSGHLIAIINYVEKTNGSSTQYLDVNHTYSLGMIASSDEGNNWSFIQPLVVTQEIANLTLKPKLCPLAGDFTELSDGSIGILYQEGDVHQIIDQSTTPQQQTNAIRSTGVVYDESRDTLIWAEQFASSTDDVTTRGGIVFCKRGASGGFEHSFRLEPRTTPPLWSTVINGLSLSPDSRHLLIPTDWGLSVLDMQAADHSEWSFQDFRTSSLAAMKSSTIQWAEWLSNTKLAFGYGWVSSTNIWGGTFDLSNPVDTYVDLKTSTSFQSPYIPYDARVLILNNVAFFIYNAYLIATDLTTGLPLGQYNTSSMNTGTLVYDNRNDEFIITAGTATIYFLKFNWDTKVFTQLRTLSSTSGNPRVYQRGGCYFNCGDNILLPPGGNPSDYTIGVYNTKQKTFIGAIHTTDVVPGFSLYPGDNSYYSSRIITIKGQQWLVWAGGDSGIWFSPVEKLGKLRYGIFVYDQNNKQLLEGDAAFYDIESPRTISADDYSQVEFPSLTSRQDGALIIYSRFSAPTRATQPFAPIITLGWTDGMTVSSKARLIPAMSLLTQGRISFGRSTNLTAKVRMVAGGNLQAVARVQQTYSNTISGLARMLHVQGPTLSIKAMLRGNNPLFVRTRMSKKQNYGLSIQSRVLKHLTHTLTAKGRLVRLTSIAAQAHLIPLRSLDIKGKISHNYTKLIAAKAHIHILGKPTLTIQAQIRKNLLQTFSGQALMIHGSAPEMRGRVSQRQGWPVPAGYDYQWLVFTETALQIRSKIGEAILNTVDTEMRARIFPVKFTYLSGQARLVSGQGIKMRAKINPWKRYIYFPCSYNVQKVEKKHARMVFYSQGFYGVGQLSLRTKIQRKSSKRFTGHFIITLPRLEGNVIAFETNSHLHFRQQLTARAFIMRG